MISDQELLNDLIKVTNGLIISYRDYDKCGKYNAALFRKRFGSWNNALRIINLIPKHVPTKATNQELIEDMRLVHYKFGKLTAKIYEEHGKYSRNTVAARFGSWNNAIKFAQLNINNRYNISEQEILEDIYKIAVINNGYIDCSLYKKYGKFSQFVVSARFGSWNNAMRLLGLEPNHEHHIDKSRLLNDILLVFNKNGTINTDLYNKEGRYCAATIRNKFGSWSNALREAGISNTSFNISESDLLKDLIEICDGKTISKSFYRKNGKFSVEHFIHKFGNWRKAQQAAGIDVERLRSSSYNRQNLLNILYSLYKKLGRTPVLDDLDCPNDTTYFKHFKKMSWYDILILAKIPIDKKRIGLDGGYYDSVEEMKVADLLYSNKINFIPHKRVCQERHWTCDFYLVDYDLWLEYDGLGKNREKLSNNKTTHYEKLKYYSDNGYKFIIIQPGDDILLKLKLK